MAKFIITETLEVIKAYQTITYEVEANSIEDAIEKLQDYYNDESDIEITNDEFDIRETEHLRFEHNGKTIDE